jgi:hypothetical protein
MLCFFFCVEDNINAFSAKHGNHHIRAYAHSAPNIAFAELECFLPNKSL